MTSDPISELRRAFGFKLEPMRLPDDGMAFVWFLHFASGDGEGANALRDAWARDTGNTNPDAQATNEETASYIDWLIKTQWGEEPKAANDSTSEVA